MITFSIKDGVLSIHTDNTSTLSITAYLAGKVKESKDFVYYNLQLFSDCRKALQAAHGEEISKVKMTVWDKDLQAAFLGLILQEHQNIDEIDLSNCNIRDTDIPNILVILRACENLKRINLSNNFISNQGADLVLKTLLESESIESLDLSHNDIGHTTCRFLEDNCKSFSKIKINLENNHEEDDIAQAKKKISSTKEIEEAFEFLGELGTEFKPGDLLYGLSEGMPENQGRNPVFAALTKALDPQDTYQLVIVNPFSDWVLLKDNAYGSSKKELVTFGEFFDSIVPSLQPQKDEPFLKFWSEHKIICKLGILWAKKNDAKIHYVLDDLRMEEFSSGSRNRADVSVTEAEIKFIARFYDNLKDNVQFWRTDKSTGTLVKATPPWLDPQTSKYWQGYLNTQKRKMRDFPQGEFPKEQFFDALRSRKAQSIVVYHAALENLFNNVISKSENPAAIGFIGKYLSELLKADAKFKIEKILFGMVKEYSDNKATLQDINLELLLDNLVKEANTYSKSTTDKFFFRRPMIEKIFGTKVLDIQALFKLADELEQPKPSALEARSY